MTPDGIFRPSRSSAPIRDTLLSDDVVARRPWLQRAPRLGVYGWVILLILGLYLIRLLQLQFLERGAWQARAIQQQSRLIQISPPRGIVFDRYGEVLVRNIPAYNVTITPGLLPDDEARERAVLMRLAQLLNDPDIPYSSVEVLEKPAYRGETHSVARAQYPPFGEAPSPGLLEMINNVRYLEPYEPIVVSQNIERELALLIAQESGVTLPGVDVAIIPRRSYTYGPTLSQILGFMGAISPEEQADYQAKGYNTSEDQIGYTGIEYQAEDYLRGEPGRKVIEKDVLGQELQVLSETAPHPGDNIYLTIDTPLQVVAEKALTDGLQEAQLKSPEAQRGVVVVLDPRDGQILALVSLPTYDNNIFNKKVDMEELQKIQDDPHRPFLNHAIADQVPPGSTFKIVPATAALQEGVINRYTTVNCPGRILIPNKFVPDDPSLAQPFYCWINLQSGGGHGPVNVVDALMHSCDVFFYEVGGGFEPDEFKGLGINRLSAYARQFGLGTETGIDIPGEFGGLVPDPTWKRQTYQETWTTGDTYNVSIGQGALQVTPLQMANALAAVVNGGTIYQPRVIHHIADAEGTMIVPFKPEVLHHMDIPESVWQIVREGLDLAVSENGTGQRARLDDLGINVAGKTGTAEYCDDIALKAGRCDVAEGETLPTHAWFMAYAPFEAPEIVVVVWIYDGGEGSVVSAPVAHDVMDYYFRRKLGLPLEGELPVEGETPAEGNPAPEGSPAMEGTTPIEPAPATP
ncbi:MAG TPA: penicillin-binding protein 2 [Anaerolineae bacterium]|nr:penicillin-binding protein 2 [Anaerolineae bacterium]